MEGRFGGLPSLRTQVEGLLELFFLISPFKFGVWGLIEGLLELLLVEWKDSSCAAKWKTYLRADSFYQYPGIICKPSENVKIKTRKTYSRCLLFQKLPGLWHSIPENSGAKMSIFCLYLQCFECCGRCDRVCNIYFLALKFQ